LEEINTIERTPQIKPISRIEPFLNIRNAISKAAGLSAISKVCAVENIHSEDEIGVFLFGWHNGTKKPKLVATEEADNFLRKTILAYQHLKIRANKEQFISEQPCRLILESSHASISAL
jgi:hypothetical protein